MLLLLVSVVGNVGLLRDDCEKFSKLQHLYSNSLCDDYIQQ